MIYLDLDVDGLWDWGEPSAITDADGVYSFTDLAAGTYTVAEQLELDWEQTAPTVPGTYTVDLDAGEIVTGRDFGNVLPPVTADPRGAIYGAKWEDTDGDGVWDDSERGLEGWTIYLDTNNKRPLGRRRTVRHNRRGRVLRFPGARSRDLRRGRDSQGPVATDLSRFSRHAYGDCARLHVG